jgi:putative glutamine amidotransferase
MNIGIVPLFDEERQSYWMLPGYMLAIENASGVPLMLPLTTDPAAIRQLTQLLDGFLLSGGQDIDPKLYGEKPKQCCGRVCLKRDAMETMLLESVLEANKPILGICRGIQMLNVFFGGTLYQDIPSQLQTDNPVRHNLKPTEPAHTVTIQPETPLFNLFQTAQITVNSFHHQGICRLASELNIAAKAPDGLIEAVYHPAKRFVTAVQWHPECSWQTDPNSQKIFSSFVKSCKLKIDN